MSVEYECERDTNLLNGDDLARVRYRRYGERKWHSFVVVLDEETTFEIVEENAEQLIALYAGRSKAEEASPTEGTES